MSHARSCDARGCCDLVVLRIQVDRIDGFPIPDGPTPAFGRAMARAQVHGATREEQRGIAPRMPVLGRDKPNRAVPATSTFAPFAAAGANPMFNVRTAPIAKV